jgi:hypothetical protein
MILRLALPVALLAAAPLARALPMPPITEWTFEGLSTSGVNASPPPASGSGTAASIGMALFTGPDNSGIAKQQGTDGANDSASNQEWKVRGTNGWSASAGLATQGAQFLVSTTGYTSIVASFDWYPSTNGEANLVVQYTLNGTGWIDATPSELTLPASATLALNSNTTDANTVTGAYLSTTAGNTWYNLRDPTDECEHRRGCRPGHGRRRPRHLRQLEL